MNILSSRAESTSCSPPPWPWQTSPGHYLLSIIYIYQTCIYLLILIYPCLQFRQVLPDWPRLRAAAGRGHGGRGAEAGAHRAVPHADPGRQGDHLTTWTPGHHLTSAAGVRRADGHLPGGGQLPHRDGRRQRAARPQAAARGHQQDIYISIYVSTYLHIYIATYLVIYISTYLNI